MTSRSDQSSAEHFREPSSGQEVKGLDEQHPDLNFLLMMVA
jgi:hypothetical protein